MAQESHYFLWLTPTEPARRALRELIESLAQQYGGPVFEPHITLLSRLQGSATDIESKVAQLAAEFAPVTVRCPTLGCSDEYYRCLYLNVEKKGALVSLYEQARAFIPHAVSRDFLPHISLVYGDLEHHTKREITAALHDHHPKSLVLDRLSLYHAPGPPATWRLVHAFPFAGERKPEEQSGP